MNLKRVRLSICWILSPVGRSVEGLSRVVMGDRLNWRSCFYYTKPMVKDRPEVIALPSDLGRSRSLAEVAIALSPKLPTCLSLNSKTIGSFSKPCTDLLNLDIR